MTLKEMLGLAWAEPFAWGVDEASHCPPPPPPLPPSTGLRHELLFHHA